ncbi:glycosyltransferase [Caproicibacterium sp. NSD3]
MRIALFSGASNAHSDASAYVSILKKSLSRAGHTVLLVTCDPEADDCYTQDDTVFCPAKVSSNYYGYAVKSSMLSPVYDIMEAFRPNIIHAVTADDMGLSALHVAETNQLPFVLTLLNLYDTTEDAGINRVYDSLLKMKARSTLRKLCTAADTICVPSGKTKEILRKLDIHCKMHRSPFCVDLETFSPIHGIDLEMREQLQIQPDETAFVFAGRLMGDCGVNELLQYWNSSVSVQDRLRLIIAGSGPDSAILTERAKMLGISSKVTFAGDLSKDDLNRCFSCCRAFVSASKSAAIKASPLEAMAAGLPVLLEQSSANAELVREGVNGFLFEHASQLGDKLRMLSQLDLEGEGLLRKLVRRSTAGLTCEALAAIMVQDYRNAMEHPHSAEKANSGSMHIHHVSKKPQNNH